MSIIISLVTILASGLVAAIVTYRLNTNKEHTFFMRRKAEELYLAFETYNRKLGAHFMSYEPVMENKITYNQLLDFQIEKAARHRDTGEDIDAVTMLTRIYFPEFSGHLDRYESVRDEINKIVGCHKNAYREGDIDGTRWLKLLHDTLLKLDRTATAYKQAITDKGRELASADALIPQTISWKTLRIRLNIPRREEGR